MMSLPGNFFTATGTIFFLQQERFSFLDQVFLDNTVKTYLITLGVILLGIVLVKGSRKLIRLCLSKTDVPAVKYLLKLEGHVYPFLYALILLGSVKMFTNLERHSVYVHYVFAVVFVFLFTRLVTAAMSNAIHDYVKEESGVEKTKQIKGIILILSAIVWVLALIFLFDNFGFNVTAILTGLGVGGIAIALAAQTILGDLFNYFVIFFDRPFEVGDFIIVDGKLGVVEYIGVKTTRVKSISGEQIIFSNSNLTGSRVHNFKRMQERRILFKFGMVYGTKSEKLASIPGLVKSIIERLDKTRFDRAHFASFGDYSLDFEVVYYLGTADYNEYMDTQQAINLELYQEFEKRGIEFAYPTYTVHMNPGGSPKPSN